MSETTVRLVRYHRRNSSPPPDRSYITVACDVTVTGFLAGMSVYGMTRYPALIGLAGVPFLLLHLVLWIWHRIDAAAPAPTGRVMAALAGVARRPTLPGAFGLVVAMSTLVPVVTFAAVGISTITAWPIALLLALVAIGEPLLIACVDPE